MVTTFTDKLSELLAEAQAKLLGGGFSWSTLSMAFNSFIHGAMLAAKDELLNSGPEKKAAVLEWVGVFYDAIITKMPLPMWLMWVKLPYFNGKIRSVILFIAGGLIESAYNDFTDRFKELPGA